MTQQIAIWTYAWVPQRQRGFVPDPRLRWAAEEAGLSYVVHTVQFEDHATNDLDRQPYGQVPFLADGDIEIFKTGACLLHLTRWSTTADAARPDRRT